MSTVASPSPSPILDAAGVAPDEALSILQTALAGADDGELFLEKTESESLVFDDGRLKGASYDAVEGFGLRVVAGETAGYAHANEISAAAIRRAGREHAEELPGAVDQAIAATDLGAGRGSWWHPVLDVLQWLALLTAVVGAGWLGVLALAGYLQFHLERHLKSMSVMDQYR